MRGEAMENGDVRDMDNCNIVLARNCIFVESTDQHLSGGQTLESPQVQIQRLDDIFSLYEQGTEIYPVVNYRLSRPNGGQQEVQLDVREHHELVFLFMNFDFPVKFIKDFEERIKDKIIPSGSNLPKDNITINAFYLDGSNYTMSSIKDCIKGNSDLLGIYIFDFNEESEQQDIGGIESFELCQIEDANGYFSRYTLEDLLGSAERSDFKSEKIMLGLFSQRLQDNVFQYPEKLPQFMEDFERDVATVILPASKRPGGQKLNVELAGFIEFLESFFNSPETYRNAIEDAQKEIKNRIFNRFENSDQTLELERNASRASTIFVGYENQGFRLHGNIEQSPRMPMRHTHKTSFRQIDTLINEIEEEEREYSLEECNNIAEHISKYVFWSLQGLNVLLQYLQSSEQGKRFKKLIFSYVMALQDDFFVEGTERKELHGEGLLQNWERFEQSPNANIIGAEVYSRLNRQSTESAFLRGLGLSNRDISNVKMHKGSSLIFNHLCPGESSSETLSQLKDFLNQANVPPIDNSYIPSWNFIFDQELVSNLLSLYFQCREVTHAPGLAKQLPIEARYSFLYWSEKRKTLQRDQLQETLSKLKEGFLKLDCDEFSYHEVPENVIQDSLEWFRGVGQ